MIFCSFFDLDFLLLYIKSPSAVSGIYRKGLDISYIFVGNIEPT